MFCRQFKAGQLEPIIMVTIAIQLQTTSLCMGYDSHVYMVWQRVIRFTEESKSNYFLDVYS